jgi:hypothetical protein
MRAAIWTTIRTEARRLERPAGEPDRPGRLVAPALEVEDRLLVRVEARGDRVGHPLHGRPALDRERLVTGHGVHDGAQRADVVAHLHEEPPRDPDHAGVVTAHRARVTARA